MQLLRKLGFPISLIYAVVVYLRNFLYDIGVLDSKTFTTTTICVGNLSVGGTGKTPMIEWLLSHADRGLKMAILSRGYGRRSKGYLLAQQGIGVEEVGDEPYQIYKKFSNAFVAVDADRQNGISILEETVGPDIILLDDAFQHRKVRCDQYVLLTAYGNLYVDDWYLPTGNLRDSKKEARRANIIVVTKCPPDLSAEEQRAIHKKLGPITGQKVVFAYLDYNSVLQGGTGEMNLAGLKNNKVTLVTGIANPGPLVSFLKNQEIEFEHLAYQDHHFFSEKEIALFNTKKVVLTTEKDYVRLAGRVKNLYFIGIKHKFLNEGEKVLLQLLNKSLSNS